MFSLVPFSSFWLLHVKNRSPTPRYDWECLSVLSGCYWYIILLSADRKDDWDIFQFFLVATPDWSTRSWRSRWGGSGTFSSFWLLRIGVLFRLGTHWIGVAGSFSSFWLLHRVPLSWVLRSIAMATNFQFFLVATLCIVSALNTIQCLVLTFSSFWLLPSLYNSYCHLGGGVVGVFQFFLVATQRYVEKTLRQILRVNYFQFFLVATLAKLVAAAKNSSNPLIFQFFLVAT